MRPNLFGPFSKKTFILKFSFRGKGWSFNLPPGLPTHWGIQPWRESWPCLRWAKSWALTHVFSFVNWPSIGNIYTMEDFKGKEIECQKCTYVQDGALQENTVQTNFKKPRSYYRMALIIWKANVLSSRTGPHLGWGTRLVVHALGATKHGTILSFFQKATPPHPPLPSPKQISTADPSTCCNTDPWQVPILSNNDCQAKVLGNKTIKSFMLCAGGAGSGTNKVNFYWIFRGEEHFSVDIFLPGW